MIKNELSGKSEAIVAADVTQIIKEMTIEIAKTTQDQEKAKDKVQKSLKKLDDGLKAFRDSGLIIIDKKTVIAGGEDITQDLREYMRGEDGEQKKD